ncbi:hypothetical protein QKW60_19825 [Defluviimonas aestuarii]|uniref:hypothetical protein n=1 Tax=Albidovulum aestuarii TaxID=1130726 RepID=UPI00249C91BC|nr:hypothetical protein [Defluviimonas aestuarii]MDI3338666.1 hypothetical protein [Defluviimonas aestuarii]
MGTSRTKIAVIAALTTILPTAALSQQGGAAGGLQVDIGVNSRLTVDDNFTLRPGSTGTSTIFDNKLTFGLSSTTGTQQFRLNGSGIFRYADIPGRTISGFEDPNLRLRYKIENSNSRLTVSGNYRSVDREFLDPFAVEQEEEAFNATNSLINPGAPELDTDGGTRTTRNAAVRYETGLNAPLGFSFGMSHDEQEYSGLVIVNPRLFDTRTDRINATATAKLSPVTTLRFNAGLTRYEADDSVQTERETVDYSVGLTQDINPVLVLDAQIGWTDVDTDTTGGSSNRSGTNGSLKLSKTLSRGSIFAALDSSLNQNGTRTSLRFGRDLQLPNGNLSASLGLTRTPQGNTDYNAAVTYDHTLKSSNITVALKRDVSTNNIDEEILDTRLTVGYGYQIDAVSSLNLSMNYGRTESADALSGIPTRTRATLSAAYSRALTQDWNMTGGVTWRRKTDDTAGDATSNSVFLSLDRNFSFRP